MKLTMEIKPKIATLLAGGVEAIGQSVTAFLAVLLQEARDDAADWAECEHIIAEAQAEGWPAAQIIRARAGLE